jgi:hypothetical protein
MRRTPYLLALVVFTLLVGAALFGGMAPRAVAQTFKKTHATEVVIGGNYGSDISHTITLAAPDIGILGSATLLFPGDNTIAGALTNDGSGTLTWEPIGVSSLTPGGINTFLVTNNRGSVNWDGLSIDATLAGNGIGTQLRINLSNPNTWTSAQNFSAGMTSAGGTTNIATTDASNVNIGIGTGTNKTNNITIGNGDGAVVPYSTTTLNGLIDIAGTTNLNTTGDLNTTIGNTGGGTTMMNGPVIFNASVTLPFGTFTAADLALADAKILVGNGASPSIAAPVTMSQDAAMDDDGEVTVRAASGAGGFTVTNFTHTNGGISNTGIFTSTDGDVNINVGTDAHALNLGTGYASNAIGIGNPLSTNILYGATTLGNIALSEGTGSIASGVLTLDDAHAKFTISSAATVTSFSGVTATTGRIILIINGDPINTLLLMNSTDLALNGDDVAMGPGGSATLMFNGTTWILLALQ